MENENKKRGREKYEDDLLVKNAKKIHQCQFVEEYSSYSNTVEENNEIIDTIDPCCLPVNGGIFDFPWLKEDPIFTASEYLEEFEDSAIVPSEYFYFGKDNDQGCSSTSFEYCLRSGLVNFHEDDDNQIDKNVDGIWSSVLDQPLDIGFHKV